MTRLLTASEVEAKSLANRAAHAPRKIDLGSSGVKKIGRPKGKWKPPAPTEHEEAKSLTLWVDFQFPLWGLDPRLFAAIPNGGQRHPAIGAKMKAEGSRAGYPDYFLAVPKVVDLRLRHGIYIELKSLNGTVQDTQHECRQLLLAQGYAHEFCYGAAAAQTVITEYLGRA